MKTEREADGSAGKESICNKGDTIGTGLITGLGRSHGKGNGNLLQYSCLENSMDKGAWWTSVHGVTKSRTQLSTAPQLLGSAKLCESTKCSQDPLPQHTPPSPAAF